MLDNKRDISLLRRYVSSYDLDISVEQASLLLLHYDLVLERNSSINLTSITDRHTALVKHIVDSLLFTVVLKELDLTNNALFIDIGTGAGYPGIPIGITTSNQGVLIDSVRKKGAVVADCIRTLGLSEHLHCDISRAETYGRLHQHAFDIAVGRAVSDLATMIEYATPLLRRTGFLIVSKGKTSEEEIDHASYTAKVCGQSLVSRETFELPEAMGTRELFVYGYECEPNIALPRRDGLASKRPLWRTSNL